MSSRPLFAAVCPTSQDGLHMYESYKTREHGLGSHFRPSRVPGLEAGIGLCIRETKREALRRLRSGPGLARLTHGRLDGLEGFEPGLVQKEVRLLKSANKVQCADKLAKGRTDSGVGHTGWAEPSFMPRVLPSLPTIATLAKPPIMARSMYVYVDFDDIARGYLSI